MDVMVKLQEVGAVLLDKHFIYNSGKHGSGYINMDPLFTDVKLMSSLCDRLGEPFMKCNVDTIAAPATGGIVLSVLTALNWRTPSLPAPAAIWADKDGSGFVFGRAGFVDQIWSKGVLIVEDLLTTGGSVAKVINEIDKAGGLVVGVSAICNRGGVTAKSLGVPRLESLANVSFDSFEADDCPLCQQAVPIVSDIGHGAEYKAEHPDYHGGFVSLLS